MNDETAYQHHDSESAEAITDQVREVYTTVFSLPPYSESRDQIARYDEWYAEDLKRPGFDLVTAHADSRIVGFGYGYTMPAGEWWRRTDRSAPSDVKASEKFALMEWAVLPTYQERGIGSRVLDELLRHRREPWGTLCVNPAAAARRIYESLGWEHVASTKPGRMPGMDVMTYQLQLA